MFLNKVISILFLALGWARVATSSSPSLSRQVRRRETSQIQATIPSLNGTSGNDVICSLIEKQSPVSVDCTSYVSKDIRYANFSLDFDETVCVQANGTQVCGLPSFWGEAQSLTGKATGTACVSDLTINTTKLSKIQFKEFCVRADYCFSPPTADQPMPFGGSVCSCSASYGGTPCQSCEVCGGGGNGTLSRPTISVDCRNVLRWLPAPRNCSALPDMPPPALYFQAFDQATSSATAATIVNYSVNSPYKFVPFLG